MCDGVAMSRNDVRKNPFVESWNWKLLEDVPGVPKNAGRI